MRLELLLKVYFAQNGNTEDILNQIELFRKEQEQQLAMLNLFEKELTPIREYDNHEDILRVLSFGQKSYRAYLEWCDETIQYLESRNPS